MRRISTRIIKRETSDKYTRAIPVAAWQSGCVLVPMGLREDGTPDQRTDWFDDCFRVMQALGSYYYNAVPYMVTP